MESMVNKSLFQSVYKNRKVFITGHTGFKGSWLTYWLHHLGAEVVGYSLDIPSSPNHFDLLKLPVRSVFADICDKKALQKAVDDFRPEIVFHLAAQSLVRSSYEQPVETFETNVIGTVNIFEAARNCPYVKAIVNVTSDKCYENTGLDIACKETDRMGGYDPYSASKGCAELVVNSYRNSYFNQNKLQKPSVLLASARAGNVIGGGDWALDRLIPDIVKANVKNNPVIIRNPSATRPWQHVLEPLSGYLLLGQLLLQENQVAADGWNFGPLNNETLTVLEVLNKMKTTWENLEFRIEQNPENLHEASLLRLDCSKAAAELKWYPIWDMSITIEKVGTWYKQFYDNNKLLTYQQLDEYINDAISKKIIWTI